ncbi:MAG: N-succinyl-L-Arg/Lys racemase [Paracidovorax wautersii]|uniref:N-succinyl-L-Arg/Lys racemase n=1 Tax=Paracidovorax wautersii TaxID=1177982 RepID=A0A7V8FS94_9BURK|nr:MAG: N-succinyl-L-Arg/Lys racemase [Paracidovorax wautersii]
MRASLHAKDLHYGNGVVLHTASSGSLAQLQSLYLRLDDGVHQAVGEVRINIAYLNGYTADAVRSSTLALLSRVDWQQPPEQLLATLPDWAGASPMPVRCLIDCALHDLVARRASLPLADWLRGSGATQSTIAYASNQTLFWSPFEVFMQQAQAYVARGFRDLKVRVAAGDFAEDLRRLRALRERFGDGIKLAADANAQWSMAEAPARLAALAPFGLAYLEQPVATEQPADLLTLAAASPMPLMLDEGLRSLQDVQALCDLRRAGGAGSTRLWAHLKLVKLGGLAPALAASRQLADAGVPFMIGQMNEGGAATAAALHLAAAVTPPFAELYGADGLADDPASGLVYADGGLAVPARPGLGIDLDFSLTPTLWSS